MSLLLRNRWVLLAAAVAFAINNLPGDNRTAAQTAGTTSTGSGTTVKSAVDRVKIKPYTGPPIYLDQAEEVAPPTVVDRQTKVEKHEDGKVWMERQLARFSDNHFEADGFYREYYPSGKPFVTGVFRRGRQHGEWTYWFENGQINRKASYKDGQPDGEWEVYRADGTLLGKRAFRDGLRHGDWVTYDGTGKKPLREEHYVGGKSNGVWKVWDAAGQLRKQISFKQGMLNGPSVEWTEKGEKRGEVSYVDNKLDGTTTIWAPDGRKFVQEYKAGRLISETKQ